jgi:galactokinase/mevalonate kinase-like predicted kinase
MHGTWDALIVTAANERQAAAYESQLAARRQLGLLADFAEVLVVADPQGRRIGSGGSTLYCLAEVLNREVRRQKLPAADLSALRKILETRRILILHAGGDSRRLPAYGPCGKIFIPVPGESPSGVGLALFDRLLPVFAAFPASPGGQVVVAAGDALLQFYPAAVRPVPGALTTLGCQATPEVAARHGVFCAEADGRVRRFLQKPSPADQARLGAVNREGQSILDVGVMTFDAAIAIALLEACEVGFDPSGRLAWSEALGRLIEPFGLDLYREICCAMGTEATPAHHLEQARASGSAWDDAALGRLHAALQPIPFHMQVLPCRFLHFGTTAQLMGSGLELLRQTAAVSGDAPLSLNNRLLPGGDLKGPNSWVEGCRVGAGLALGGRNVVVGVDVTEDLALPAGACLDLVAGRDRAGRPVWFVRCYGVEDSFKDPVAAGGTYCGRPMADWLAAMKLPPEDISSTAPIEPLRGGSPDPPRPDAAFYSDGASGAAGQETRRAKRCSIWDAAIPAAKRTLWDARVFPAVASHGDFRRWLWLFGPGKPTADERQAFLAADRYSAAEVALLADQDAFYSRRDRLRADEMRTRVHSTWDRGTEFSAEDLAHVLSATSDRAAWVADLLGEARSRLDASAQGTGLETFVFCRILHSLGSALPSLDGGRPIQEGPVAPPPSAVENGRQTHSPPRAAVPHGPDRLLADLLPGLAQALPAATMAWLDKLGLAVTPEAKAHDWAARARDAAFEQMNAAILQSSMTKVVPPRCRLRPDETVWGRAPARLELGGGWTDTPPYTLEHGGSVANAAVNLSGQPPIHCYCRVTGEAVIRLGSLDTGQHAEVRELEALLDYRRPGDSFALMKAALAIAGFSPEMADWPRGTSLRDMLREFGGGLELTTVVGIPKGSGLGTSSIIGAVLVAVINRVLGRPLGPREIFHDVLRLEQALTTGGGWQDQVGGGVGGTKITTTLPGMFPDPCIRYVPSDLLDPARNGGSTLIYYTGLTRLAKNILQQIVVGYFNRNRTIMSALAREHEVARAVADALCRKDAAEFGACINEAWRLQKQLCGEVTNEAIESLLARVAPHIHGARISGAGSGGFLIMICKSPRDAAAIREDLEARPLNDRSRFFEYQINDAGLEVVTC